MGGGGGNYLLLTIYCLLYLKGGVGERLKPPVLKTGVHFVDREFESRPLRQKIEGKSQKEKGKI